MKQVLIEKSQALADETGWPMKRAEGYVDGEIYRRRGLELSSYHKNAMDDYAKGFRTGYYKEAHSISSDEFPETPLAT